MHKPTKYLDKGITLAAGAAWNVVQFFNQFKPNDSFTPKWSDKPLLKSYQKSKPTLGWPRTTDSLCPVCVREARKRILNGEQDWRTLTTEKDCPERGHLEDVLAMDPEFLQHIERMFPGRDIQAHNDKDLHKHGSSTI